MKFLNQDNERTYCFNLYKTNKIVNYTDFFDQLKDRSYFYNFNFKTRKQFKKTYDGKLLKIKKSSYRRDRNTYMLNLLMNLSTRKGLKETFFKNFNFMVYYFLEQFNEESSDFNQYPQFYYYHILSKYKLMYNDFETIFDDCIRDLKIMFNIKYKKLDKKQRMKAKQKYLIIIKLIPEKNRLKHILNLVNRSLGESKYKTLHKRLLKSLSEIIFDTNNSFISRRKSHVYSIVFEDLKKKNE